MCSQSRLDLFFVFRVHLTIYHEQLNLIEKLCLTLQGATILLLRPFHRQHSSFANGRGVAPPLATPPRYP
jgi:hypothetical protein